MTETSQPTDRVSPEELELWRTFARVHATVHRRLEADLIDNHGLPLAWYEVMARLVETPDRKMRMSELADRVMLSPSGLTRLVDRLVAEGLLRRLPVERDGRGYYAVLTDEGFEVLRSATGTHLRGVREYVITKFNPDELLIFSEYFGRMEA